jgi:hypothetical protein
MTTIAFVTHKHKETIHLRIKDEPFLIIPVTFPYIWEGYATKIHSARGETSINSQNGYLAVKRVILHTVLVTVVWTSAEWCVQKSFYVDLISF